MAILNEDGCSISYECGELIEELREDIAEFGPDTQVIVWCQKREGVVLCVNYDFVDEIKPIKPEEMEKDEFLVLMSMKELMDRLVKQDSIF